MEQIIGIPLLILLTGASISAFFLVGMALFPARIEKVRRVIHDVPGRSFWVGLVNFLFFSALSLGFLALGENLLRLFLIPAVMLLVLLAIGLLFGLTGIVQVVGNRLFTERSYLRRNLYGALALYFACLTPFIGWFILLVYVGVTGLGAFILSFVRSSVEPSLEENID